MTSTVKTVALTGATGFIGRTLLQHLIAQGYRVKALYRPNPNHQLKPTDAVEWISGNLDDLESLRDLVADVDAIVHCAGSVRGTTLPQFQKVNSEGVARLLEIASNLNVSKFILMSSLAAREPGLSAYASSKKQGEDVLREYRGEVSWQIIRPPAVYGPGDREMLPLLKLIKRGIVPVVGGKTGRFSLIHVDDLSTAVLTLLNSDNNENKQCFELHDGHPDGYNWQQIAAIATTLNGKQPCFLSVPRILMQIAGATNAFLAGLLGYQPMLTSGKVRELFHPDWTCNNTEITRATGWQPKVSFQEGMQQLLYPDHNCEN